MKNQRYLFISLLITFMQILLAKSDNNSILKNLVIGAGAGSFTTAAIEPLMYLKNRLQQHKKIHLNPCIWYRSLFTNATGFVPAFTIQNVAYSELDKCSIPIYKEGLAILSAGIASSIIDCPRELISIHQQNQGDNFYNLIKSYINEHGYKKLFRGLIPTILRNTSFVFSLFTINPQMKSLFQENNNNKVMEHIVPGIITGTLFATLTHPIDTIKTSMQGKIENTNTLKVAQSIYGESTPYKKPSVTNFYRGLTPRLLSVVASITILSCTLEYLNKLIET